jgi:hypothetical protein
MRKSWLQSLNQNALLNAIYWGSGKTGKTSDYCDYTEIPAFLSILTLIVTSSIDSRLNYSIRISVSNFKFSALILDYLEA